MAIQAAHVRTSQTYRPVRLQAELRDDGFPAGIGRMVFVDQLLCFVRKTGWCGKEAAVALRYGVSEELDAYLFPLQLRR